MKRRYGFTLIELLVVVAIIALLVSILMPALGRARELANQVKCATQLNGIGKAIALYGNDYKDAYPTICTSNATGVNLAWQQKYLATNPRWHNGPANALWDEQAVNIVAGTRSWKYATAGGCIYLLVRYEDLVPNMFLCPSADYAEEMELQEAQVYNTAVENWDDIIDFNTLKNLNYSIHDPFNKRLDSSSTSSMPVMADMSPVANTDACDGTADPDYLGTKQPDSKDNPNAGDTDFNPDWTDWNGTNLLPGNSPNHGYDVQNVLFADSHVKKHDRPDVGIQDDNIYTHWVIGAALNQIGPNNQAIGQVNAPGKWDASVNQLSQATQDAYLFN